MIEYVEIRNAENREIIGIVDNASSVIWHSVYYGVGDFEIYAPCTALNIELLQIDNYVTQPNDKNIGVIENIQITYNAQDGRMIVATGRFAKALLDRRLIYKMSGNSVSPTIISGNVENAARSLVSQNAVACAFDNSRNISGLVLGASAGTSKVIVDEAGTATQKQVTYENLLSYTDELLAEYKMGAYCELNEGNEIAYKVFDGADRSVDNVGNNQPIIFSQEFDNLITSDYLCETEEYKTAALVGGEGEGTARFCTLFKPSGLSGLDLRETFINASSNSKTYKDDDGTEHTLTDAEYEQTLKALGQQKVAGLSITETFNGEVDLINSSFKYGENEDFYLGDIVTVQDNGIGLYMNTRVLEILETQDESGYTIVAVFGE